MDTLNHCQCTSIISIASLRGVVERREAPIESQTSAWLQLAERCINGEELSETDVEAIAAAIHEHVASAKSTKPPPPAILSACLALRLSSPGLFFAASCGRKNFTWHPTDAASLKSAISEQASFLKDQNENQVLRAGAMHALGSLGWRDPEGTRMVCNEPGVLSSLGDCLSAASQQEETLLSSTLFRASTTAAACSLGVLLMLEPGAIQLVVHEHGEQRFAASLVALLKLLVESSKAQIDESVAHCLYQVTFLIQVVGGACSSMRVELVKACVAEPLVAALDCNAKFGTFAVTARAALAIGALFTADSPESPGVDVRVEIEQAQEVCACLASSLTDDVPITPWMVARDMAKLADDNQNRANLKAAGAVDLLVKGVGSNDNNNCNLGDLSLNLLLTERWCAQAVVKICAGDSSKMPVWLPHVSTLAALFCGIYATLAASTHHRSLARFCMLLACVFDLLDAKLVNLLGVRSQYGTQYDSLSDIFGFAVAPAMLMHSSLLADWGLPGLLTTFCYMACAGLRHARQVTLPESSHYVRGLPSNVAAVVMLTVELMISQWAYYDGWLAGAIGMFTSLACAVGMASEIKHRNHLPDFDLRQAAQAAALLAVGMCLASIFPPQPVLLAMSVVWMAVVLQLRGNKDFVAVCTLLAAAFAALLCLSDKVLPREDLAKTHVVCATMLVWLPFTRIATFASFLKVKKAQKLLITHWVRQATGLDFHHFHLGALLLLIAISGAPFASGSASLVLCGVMGIGLSYILDQAAPVLVKTFGKNKHIAHQRCLACDRASCPWRWGSRGLCYFARESTVAAATLHAMVIFYIIHRPRSGYLSMEEVIG